MRRKSCHILLLDFVEFTQRAVQPVFYNETTFWARTVWCPFIANRFQLSFILSSRNGIWMLLLLWRQIRQSGSCFFGRFSAIAFAWRVTRSGPCHFLAVLRQNADLGLSHRPFSPDRAPSTPSHSDNSDHSTHQYKTTSHFHQSISISHNSSDKTIHAPFPTPHPSQYPQHPGH